MNNHHATCVVLRDRGIMIDGPSGSGKTTLGFTLIEGCLATGHAAAFVADDQVLADAVNGRLIARAPRRIAGLAELHGLGIVGVAFAECAVVDLIVTLTHDPVDRLPEPATLCLDGVELPHLLLPARSAETAQRLILGRFRMHATRPEGHVPAA